jgi:hypothetical protein
VGVGEAGAVEDVFESGTAGEAVGVEPVALDLPFRSGGVWFLGEDAVLAAFFIGGKGSEFGFDFRFTGRGRGGEAQAIGLGVG